MNRIALCLLILTTALPLFGAEMLVRAKEHWLDKYPGNPEYKSRPMPGNIVVVRPDGWQWGRAEKLPEFVVIKVMDIGIDEAREYEKAHNYSVSPDLVSILKAYNMDSISISSGTFKEELSIRQKQ